MDHVKNSKETPTLTRKLVLLAIVLSLAALPAAADKPTGDAMTLWGVFFNNPGACSDGMCGEDDIFADPGPPRTAVVLLGVQRIPPSGRAPPSVRARPSGRCRCRPAPSKMPRMPRSTWCCAPMAGTCRSWPTSRSPPSAAAATSRTARTSSSPSSGPGTRLPMAVKPARCGASRTARRSPEPGLPCGARPTASGRRSTPAPGLRAPMDKKVTLALEEARSSGREQRREIVLGSFAELGYGETSLSLSVIDLGCHGLRCLPDR